MPLPLETNPVIRPAASSLFENRDRPLAGDERLVVGADENLGALIKSIADQALGDVMGGETALGSRSACEVTQF